MDYKSVRFESAKRLILYTIPGIPVGLFLLKGVEEGTMKMALGLFIGLFALFRLARPTGLRLRDERLAPLAGFIAGVLGGAYNTNGPPVVVYGTLRGWTPKEFRATLQGYFVVSGLVIATGHGLSGLWTAEVGKLYVLTLPAIAFSLVVGGWLHRRIPGERFNNLVYLLLLAIAAMLIFK